MFSVYGIRIVLHRSEILSSSRSFSCKSNLFVSQSIFRICEGSYLHMYNVSGNWRKHCYLTLKLTGIHLQVKEFACFRSDSFSYHQRGVVATVRTEPRNETALQRFLETGPLAVLPVRDGYSNIVWSTTPIHARELEKMDSRQFSAAVNDVSFWTLLLTYSSQSGGFVRISHKAYLYILMGYVPRGVKSKTTDQLLWIVTVLSWLAYPASEAKYSWCCTKA